MITHTHGSGDGDGEGRWWRVGLILLPTILTLIVAVGIKPRDLTHTANFQPTITILASQPGVSATVSMVAKEKGAAPAESASTYELALDLRVLNPATTRDLEFVVQLSDFPRAVGLAPLLPSTTFRSSGAPVGDGLSLPTPQLDGDDRADYVAVRILRPGAHQAVFQFYTTRPVVAVPVGSDLQITFPLVQDEVAAPAPVASTALPVAARSYFGPYASLPVALPGNLYQPALEPGTTQYRANGQESLPEYQTLAGDQPSIKPGDIWAWSGVGDVSLLAQNVLAANVEQSHLFWSGAMFGVAAAGGIATLVELFNVIQRYFRRRQRQQTAVAQTADDVAPAEAGA